MAAAELSAGAMPDSAVNLEASGRRGWADRLVHFGLSLALFLLVVGANWDTSIRYGSPIPNADQWDAEGLNLLAPWFTRDHFIAHLFHPHNEHRVILTKLQNLAVVLWGGQWDTQVERLFNALLHGFIAVGLWCLARRYVAPRWRALVYVVIGALYALPLSWEDLLGGFHSQQYWLVGLSVAAIVLLPWARQTTVGWWIGLAAALLVMGAMGSGFFAAAVVIAVLAWRLLQREIRLREAWITIALMLGLIAVGVATRVVIPPHAALQARSVGEFFLYLVRSLAWPIRDHDWAGVILWAPWAIVVARIAWQGFPRPHAWLSGDATPSSRLPQTTATRASRLQENPRQQAPDPSRIDLTLAALGGWVGLQVLATAYARGAGADYPAPRYMETLMLGSVVNAIAAARLLSRPQPALRMYLVGALWWVTLGLGLAGLVKANLANDFPAQKAYYAGSEAHLRAYLATDNPATLTDPIPYIDSTGMIERLAPPSIRAVMPAVVRPPLALAAAAAAQPTFVAADTIHGQFGRFGAPGLSPQTSTLEYQRTWGSYGAADGAKATGTWRSAALTSPMQGWLKFEMAGNVGEPGVALELHDATSNALLAAVDPSKMPGNTWRSAYVRAPRQPFIIVARDADPQRWIAFSAPVEMSTLSYWSWRLMKNGLLLAEVAAALAAVLSCVSLVTRLNAWGRMPRWGRDAPVAFSPNRRDGGAAAPGQLSPPVASVGPQNQPKFPPSE